MNTDLDPRLLRAFVAVAHALHFRRAAASLNATQSALSLQIKELERRVGAELLARSRRGVALTAAGAVFLPEAAAILARIEAAGALARDVSRGRRGEVTIGLIGAATFEAAPNLFRLVERYAHDVRIMFREMTARDQLASLRSGEGPIDAGLVRAEARASGLSFRTVLREPVVCLLSEHHRLAAQPCVNVADLENEPVLNLARDSDPAGHDAYLAIYRAAGFEPRIVVESSDVTTILFAIAAQGCVALGPAGWRVLRRDGVVVRPLTEPAPEIETRLVWNPQKVSPAFQVILDLDERVRVAR